MANRINQERSTALIYLSSMMPGTGLTTVSELVAELLDLDRVSPAGKIRRALAQHWDDYRKQHLVPPTTDISTIWNEFQSAYEHAYNEALYHDNFEPLERNLGKYLYNSPFIHSENVLQQFSKDQQTHQTTNFWDRIPEVVAKHELERPTEKAGILYEGKFSIIAEQLLDNLKQSYAALSTKIPKDDLESIVRILLVVENTTSARRVFQRELAEGNLIPPTSERDEVEIWHQKQVERLSRQNDERVKRDELNVSQAFGITVNELKDLMERSGSTVIDTTHLSITEAVRTVITIIADSSPAMSRGLLYVRQSFDDLILAAADKLKIDLAQ